MKRVSNWKCGMCFTRLRFKSITVESMGGHVLMAICDSCGEASTIELTRAQEAAFVDLEQKFIRRVLEDDELREKGQ